MFTNDVNNAVDCLRPLLKKLELRNETRLKNPMHLIAIPELDFLGLESWTLTVIKEKTVDSSCGRLITRYRKEHNAVQCIIVLDDSLYYDTDISRKKRKIVAVHEFCHFVACVYAYTTDKNKFFSTIEEKRDNRMNNITNPDVSILYRLLNESRKDSEADETLDTFKHAQHTHFYLGFEKIDISYTDLYLNLLFSRGTFEEFFDLEKQKQFFDLWRNNKRQEALHLYNKVVIDTATEKWIPMNFALSQAQEWLMDYIRNPIK